MRILVIHEHYRQPGGEDRVFETEVALLRAYGCEVECLTADNREIDESDAPLRLAANTVWSSSARLRVREAVRRFRPDVAHIHNWFPLLSPAIHGAIRAEGVPVVQTLHNFRLMCLNGLFFRDGAICTDCAGSRLPWRGVLRRCYRDNLGASAAVAAMIGAHRLRRTWARDVDLFFALNGFSRDCFIAAGLPPEKVAVRLNPILDPGAVAAGWDHPRAGAVYVGRLSEEKGAGRLSAVWRGIGHRLTVIGDGPLAPVVQAQAGPEVDLCGWQDPAEVSARLSQAALVCVPSQCYEQMPMALLEATAHGVPVLVSDVGVLGDLAEGGGFGCRVPSGDPDAWVATARALLAAPDRLREMGLRARQWYLETCSPDASARRLLTEYGRLKVRMR